MTTAINTFQSIEIESKAGRAFLRKVANNDFPMDNGWKAYASEATQWKWRFSREIDNGIGMPRTLIEVTTNSRCCGASTERETKQSFHDSKPVTLLGIRSVHIHWSACKMLAKLLLDGFSARVERSAGSVSSSEHGLSFYSLEMRGPIGSVYLGSDTIAKDGRTICGGNISVG